MQTTLREPWNKGIRMKTRYVCDNLTCAVIGIDVYNNNGKHPKKDRKCPLCNEIMRIDNL